MPPGDGTGRHLSDLEIYALLSEKGYSQEQIEKMDRWWIINVIFYPRNEKGNLIPRPGFEERKKNMDPKQAFWIRHKDKGYADWQIQESWKAMKRE